jgi:Zn-dependent peptidase ImmA (M78 family)
MTLLPATDKAIATLDTVWQWISDFNMLDGSEKPKLQCFSKNMEAQSTIRGYYEEGTVFINVDEDNNRYVMMHELAHHITGAQDGSYDFSEFGFTLATRMGELIFD